jgi:hypothetical protein
LDSSSLCGCWCRLFISAGSLLILGTSGIIGIPPLVHGGRVYTVLFVVLLLLQVAYITANARQIGFIPDLVPESHHSLASGEKVLFVATSCRRRCASPWWISTGDFSSQGEAMNMKNKTML